MQNKKEKASMTLLEFNDLPALRLGNASAVLTFDAGFAKVSVGEFVVWMAPLTQTSTIRITDAEIESHD